MKTCLIPFFLLLITTTLQLACVNNPSSPQGGISVKEVRDNGLHAQFFSQEHVQLKPAIILIGGGEWGDYWGSVFADKGYVALSLPYNRREGLPQLLEEIPLEYVEKAIDWLEADPTILPNRIFLMGASRNAELALMAASTFPDKVDGVFAYAPGAVHWSNTVLPYNTPELKPTWTLNGEAVPFVEMERLEPGEGKMLDLLSYWEKGLSDSVEVEKAFIPVEKIKGPVFLFSGNDDKVWPSATMADMIQERLERNGTEYPFHNIKYENAGHLISGNPDSDAHVETGQMYIDGKAYDFEFGGTKDGDKYAQQDAREMIFEYLAEVSKKN